MKILRFAGIGLGAIATLAIAIVVVFAWTLIRSGDMPHFASGGAVPSATGSIPAAISQTETANPADAARQAVVERSGSDCIRRASIFFAPNAPLAEGDDLGAAVAAAGGTQRWLFPDAAARGARPAWIGDLKSATVAFGGDLVATGQGIGWIMVDRSGNLAAIELRQRVAPSGETIWWPANEIVSVVCPSE